MRAETLRRIALEFNLELPDGHTVLLVDDEETNLSLLETALDAEYTVHTAASGAEALARLRELDGVDLVMSDQRMPRMTGVELLERVASEWPSTVRVVLTAYADVEPMIAAINRGAVHRFLLKPWRLAEVRATLADALSERAHRIAVAWLVGDLVARRDNLRATMAELQVTQEQILAAERSAALGRFTSGITHEIRNQLSPLKLLLESIGTADSDPEVVHLAAVASEALDALEQLVGTVTAFARNQSLRLQPREVVAADFVRSVVELADMDDDAGGERPTSIVVRPGAERIRIDPSHVSQALIALLRNARRASARRSEVEVSVATDERGAAVIAVRDEGTGMDAATLARAVEPFFSAFHPPGPGLGLGIARLVAESHGGSLEIESHSGEGTVARLRIPPIIGHT